MIVHPADRTHGPASARVTSQFKRLLAASLCLTLLSSAALAQSQVALTWSASTDATVLGYYLHQGGASGNYTNTIDVGTATSVTVSNLTVGGTYYFALTAYNSYDLESPRSAEVSYAVANPAPPPTTPPAVVLTAPTSGASYVAPATVKLSANVTTNGHTITQVQFYNGTSLLGSSTVPPYAATWSGVAAGSYSLTARVVYDAGSTLASSPATITVTNPAPTLPPTIALTAPASGSSYAAPATVNLSASVTANGHTISQVQFYNGTALIGSSSVSPYATTWSGVSTGNYSLFARVVYDSGSTLDSAQASITVTNPAAALGLPAPWQTLDIGAVGATGSATATNGTFTVMGAGTISGSVDKFRFVYQPLSGDGEIQARINATQSLNGDWAGVMIRESLTPSSAYGLVGVVSGNVGRFAARTSTGGNPKSFSVGTVTPPNIWVRLVRSGNTLYGYRSTDGVNWGKAISHYNVPMASNIYIGLAVASGNTSSLNAATFSSLTVVP